MEQKLSLQSWIAEATREGLSFGDYCLAQQAEELELSREELLARMERTLKVMREAVDHGLSGVRSRSGLSGGGARQLSEAMAGQPGGGYLLGFMGSRAMVLAVATAEANASMGRIVAAPTAGSSGVLPGVLLAVGEAKKLSDRQLAKGLVVAGCIGLVIASRATLSGAEGGCQAECGSAAAMAAGAAVDLCGGSPAGVGAAVAVALKNTLGLVCDPVAGLVEVPCVKRNAGAAVQALAAAELALCGLSSAIPPDEVIDAMAAVGRCLPETLKETARGGLATTPTGRALLERYTGTPGSCGACGGKNDQAGCPGR